MDVALGLERLRITDLTIGAAIIKQCLEMGTMSVASFVHQSWQKAPALQFSGKWLSDIILWGYISNSVSILRCLSLYLKAPSYKTFFLLELQAGIR
jgi:hypothetical protein